MPAVHSRYSFHSSVVQRTTSISLAGISLRLRQSCAAQTAIAFVWRIIFNGDFGLLNYALGLVGISWTSLSPASAERYWVIVTPLALVALPLASTVTTADCVALP